MVVLRNWFQYIVCLLGSFVEEADHYFVKTIIPNRKATRDYLKGGVQMRKRRSSYEEQIARDYEKGRFKSVAPAKAELKRFKEAARVTFIKNRMVNVQLSSPDLMDIQTRAAEEGVPYQTLIASVLHKFVTGRFTEKSSRLTTRSTGRTKRRRAA